ncbi:FadR/GntR family transcriptional regulator [Aestuariivirga sp. YIM B02566]|uniref:FadR family transcriptional regulator n=1 Tax=Taklimakanibacter albus TaxID=2800327 RepID=A0ACC5RBR1_9HYPH|nr:FCD domain-containing protein [Aestuariivirga sp. YIM B02566]MBK1870034.1 FadR family transcriptional regulator [Aestuariivirga sp. YIM B02566]
MKSASEAGLTTPDSTEKNAWDAPVHDEGRAAFTQLQAFLAQFEPSADGRLPAERELCETLGVSRGALRKALAIAESEGRIWRHVGKGTFLGQKPIQNLSAVSDVANFASPAEVLRARLIIEPQLACEAALHASQADLAELQLCARRGREAETWRRYENWDNRFHRAIANATQNKILIMIFDNLNNVRRTMAWGRRRDGSARPAPEHHSFKEHDEIVQAIFDRDCGHAEQAMRQHIETVTRKMMDGTRAE